MSESCFNFLTFCQLGNLWLAMGAWKDWYSITTNKQLGWLIMECINLLLYLLTTLFVHQ